MPTGAKSTADALIYLVGCALHDVVPEEAYVAGVDAGRLLRLARAHSLTLITSASWSRTAACRTADPAVKEQWAQARANALTKVLLLDHERTQLLAELERAGIRYMPLKGSVLNALYPRREWREMSDLDILYDRDRQKQVRELMAARGYTAESVGYLHHDVYQKKPVYECEMHTALYSRVDGAGLYRYYQNTWEKPVKDERNAYGYHFSDEDLYVYIVSHAYKHFSQFGTGLRSLVDQYVFLMVKAASMNWRYVDGELERMGIGLFERQTRALAEKLFADPGGDAGLSEEEYRTLDDIISAGTHGTVKKRTEKALSDMGGGRVTKKIKLKYLFRRLFPTREWMMLHDPVCERHPWRIPFRRVRRICLGMTSKMKAIRTELKYVRKM